MLFYVEALLLFINNKNISLICIEKKLVPEKSEVSQ